MTEAIRDLPGWARTLLEEARVGRLGLLDDRDRPRVLPVTFGLHGDAIWTAVDRKPKRHPDREPARLRFVRRRPEIALTVDHYDEDWEQLAWVLVLGRSSVLDAGECGHALEALAGKYEQYRSEPPPGPLIRIEPERVLTWRAKRGEDG